MSQFGNYKGSPEWQEMMKQNRLSMANVVIDAALNTITLCKQLPRNGKRNPFNKSYNRRPRNKQRRALVMAQIAISARLARTQLEIISSQPLPKYPKGAL